VQSEAFRRDAENCGRDAPRSPNAANGFDPARFEGCASNENSEESDCWTAKAVIFAAFLLAFVGDAIGAEIKSQPHVVFIIGENEYNT
jgi:hypothetical protein